MSFLLDNLETILELALLVWALLVTTRLTLRWLRAQRSLGERQCPACGQIIFARTERVCLECGHDLCVNGTRSSVDHPRLRPHDSFILLSLLLSLATLDYAPQLASSLPIGWYFQATRHVDLDGKIGGATDDSGVTIQAFGYGRYFSRRPETIRIASHRRSNKSANWEGVTINSRIWTVEMWGQPPGGAYGQVVLRRALAMSLSSKTSKEQEAIVEEIDADVRALASGAFPSEDGPDPHAHQSVLYAQMPNMRMMAQFVILVIDCVSAWLITKTTTRIARECRRRWWFREPFRTGTRTRGLTSA